MINSHRDFICFKLDIRNASNEISRRAVLDVLEGTPSLSHMVTFAATILTPVIALEKGGRKWGETGADVVQGDSPSGDFFAIGL